MLVGGLDVATPTIFSRPAEPFLSNHVYNVINAGHATAFLPCVLDMVESWLSQPGVPPQNSCPTTYTWAPSAFQAGGIRPVPAVSPAGLAGLVAVLSMVGMLVLRRRRREG